MLTVSLLVWAMVALATADDDVQDSPVDPTAGVAASSCPTGWSEGNGRCYLYISEELSWFDAEVNCKNMNASLVSVHNSLEFNFLLGMISVSHQDEAHTWIGGSSCQSDVWAWSDDSDFNFAKWCDGQPDSRGFTILNSGADNCWVVGKCSTTHPSVCAM